MSPEFTVWIIVSRPPAEVYEAVADPAVLSRYFTTGGAVGRLESGQTVQWDFHDFPGAFPVEVIEAVPPERIHIGWGRRDGSGNNDVRFRFEPVDGGSRTKVSVSESGWANEDAGWNDSYGNCMGWSQMLAALKMWVEHGINLREGAYK
ncbi:MAG: SRPBCC domain-containing protein [Sphingomonadales bacterium]|nr:SRPBCC domain-containing protein [Sphingomonadales bacterium]